ncbi:aminotransferase class V-fold PLP-dependent enzyme [Pseudoalteromonas sp. T1lg65]|uniref:aminotransferase class V-fold PLP-dependent enzyme n=1 Tax=Pseudoalteromonas sp. T1lg65 TaxID=2077101 RepID=UPI003F79B138
MNDIAQLRSDFPIFDVAVDGNPLCYLDSAATSQKPQAVIDVIKNYYSQENANVHRGLHTLSQRATQRYEMARETLAEFLNVTSREIVWTSGATESLNLLAFGLTASFIGREVILLSPFEHHANIVPWQEAAKRTGARIEILPITEQGILDLPASLKMIEQLRPAVLSIAQASNTLGNIHPIEPLIEACKKLGTITVIDGAQSLLHLQPDLTKLGCDFFVFSAHKALGPTGVGGLFGRYELLNALPVYKTGGEMIATVRFSDSTYRDAPEKFEPGTPNISGVIAFSEAIKYLQAIDKVALHQYEQKLYRELLQQLTAIDGVTVHGDTNNNIGIVSFSYKNEHHYDLATLLNSFGVAVRSGHHCTQPLMAQLGLDGTIRASLAFYNNNQDINRFINALEASIDILD